MAFEEVKISELQFNPFDKISRQWMLITAGKSSEDCNTMTASWGGVGIMWGKPVATAYIRPQRYTRSSWTRMNISPCLFSRKHTGRR